jgi:hypothetical protein
MLGQTGLMSTRPHQQNPAASRGAEIIDFATARRERETTDPLDVLRAAVLKALQEEQHDHPLCLSGARIVWSRSARKWRRVGWRQRNPHSSPY